MIKKEYQRISERLLRGQPKAKKFGRLVDQQFLTGTMSLHRTRQSVKWRTFWRLKHVRAALQRAAGISGS